MSLQKEEKDKEMSRELLTFLNEAKSQFHAVAFMKEQLLAHGYEQLLESRRWNLKAGGRYFVIRGGSSILAFRIPLRCGADYQGFQIMASHSDSPTFRIKESPEMAVEGHYIKLNVEKYGGAILAPWFDRPLSVAGRLLVRKKDEQDDQEEQGAGQIETRLIAIDRDLVLIPSLAIHMNREVNSGYNYNVQRDLLPLYGMVPEDGEVKGSLMKMIAEEAGVKPEDILGSDLFLYNRVEGTIWGAADAFVSAGRLDDLQCAFSSLKAFFRSEELAESESIPVHLVFDNEEVGSGTRQGAASTFLYDCLTRINEAMGRSQGDYIRSIASSFMLSADNAHAVHPNHTDKTCPTNRPYLNSGIVLKYNAAQKYTTDGFSASVFKQICKKAGVPCQVFLNRSDMAGGSTLGNISAQNVPMNTVDIGLPQLAMHSPYETAGVYDTEYMIKAATVFFASSMEETADGCYRLHLGETNE